MDWRVPNNFKWEQYTKLDRASFLNLSSTCMDNLAEPHAFLCVGSSLSQIPKDADVVLNVADNCPERKDVGRRQCFHIGLSDPVTDASTVPFVKAVRLTVKLITRQRRIFLHCMCGINRSVSVAATATAILTGEGVVDVLVRMSQQRPEIYPDVAYIILGQWLNGELPHPSTL